MEAPKPGHDRLQPQPLHVGASLGHKGAGNKPGPRWSACQVLLARRSGAMTPGRGGPRPIQPRRIAVLDPDVAQPFPCAAVPGRCC